MKRALAGLLAGTALLAAGVIGHDLGIASGEAKIERYKRERTPTYPGGIIVDRWEDGSVTVTCPAEDSCSIDDNGPRVYIRPRTP